MRTRALLVTTAVLSRITLADDDVFQLGLIEVNANSDQQELTDKETITSEASHRNRRNKPCVRC